jgi:phenylacetate-coenzyme A ligase PaaK-like adenylate-forming protein
MQDEKIFHYPKERLREIQDSRLREFVNRKLYPFSPHYRKLFDRNGIDPRKIKRVEDLQHIPFTSKEDLIAALAQDPLDFVLQPDEEAIKKFSSPLELARLAFEKATRGPDYMRETLEREYKPIFLTATTGTTKTPISFLYTARDIKRLKLYGRRMATLLGCVSKDRAVNLFPYAPHLAFWQVAFTGFASDLFIFSTGGGRVISTDLSVQTLLKIKPNLLIGTADFVYHVLKAAKEKKCELSFIKTVVLGASRVPKGFKTKLIELMRSMNSPDVRVIGTYGFTEARGAWTECPVGGGESSGYHFYPDKEIFEVVDPVTGKVLGEGADGEIVYTTISGRGSCVFRYRTGDIVKGGITYEPCPHCGRTLPRLASDISRAYNVKNLQLSKIKGTLVDLNHLEYLLDDEKTIDQWQIEITKKNDDPYEVDEIRLYLKTYDHVDEAAFAKRLNEKITAVCEITLNLVEFVPAEEIRKRLELDTSVKAKKIVDRRPKV